MGEKMRCPVAITVDMIGGKWKPTILVHLKDLPRRFNALRRRCTVNDQVPPRVDYALSDYG